MDHKRSDLDSWGYNTSNMSDEDVREIWRLEIQARGKLVESAALVAAAKIHALGVALRVFGQALSKAVSPQIREK